MDIGKSTDALTTRVIMQTQFPGAPSGCQPIRPLLRAHITARRVEQDRQRAFSLPRRDTQLVCLRRPFSTLGLTPAHAPRSGLCTASSDAHRSPHSGRMWALWWSAAACVPVHRPEQDLSEPCPTSSRLDIPGHVVGIESFS